ncbi:MAG: CheR family methyltransferase [Thermodesulfobacteriota bacterium]|nr:CheR family methyltransferase [Thermodesulfobacteriota bacterium]
MTHEEYGKLAAIIREKSGINLEYRDHGRISNLARARFKALRLRSFGTYIEYIQKANAAAELEQMINEITVPETYFFRDINQCNALRDYVLPNLVRSKEKKRIRIWSAGCSTGEEAFTIAIIAMQGIPNWKLWDIEIIGTDINRDSIEKARKGIYKIKSFRGIGEGIVDKYFIKTGKGMNVREPIRSLVQFETFNMKLDEGLLFPVRYSGIDVIFCRNVLIYFGEEVIRNVIKGFHDSLLPGGYLILGHSEMSLAPKGLFRPVRTNDTFLQERKEPKAQNLNHEPSNPYPAVGNRWPAVSDVQHKAGDSRLEMENERSEIYGSTAQPDDSTIYANAFSLYLQERYAKAEAELEKSLSRNDVGIETLLLAALIWINLGDSEKAKSYVRKMQEKDEFLPEAHFILGLIHENENDYELATREYQAALFLNGNSFLPYFRLGHLYQKTGKRDDSVRAYREALSVIRSQDEEKVRLLSGGFSKKSLEDICRRSV